MSIDFIIGGIGGIVSRTFVAPIELNRIQKPGFYHNLPSPRDDRDALTPMRFY